MSDPDRALWEEEAPDPLLHPVWEDDPDAADPALRPVWEDLPDETEPPPLPRRSDATRTPDGSGSRILLAPLAAAQDALARLDARAEAAPAPIRAGLIARLAFREAAGWLAAQHAWVHPHDLALRAENLAGRFDNAAQIARPRQALPSTVATQPGGWADPADLAALAQAETQVVRALALARLLTALPRTHDPFAGPDAAARFLGPLGVGDLDTARFAGWRAALPAGRSHAKAPSPALPPLLHAANAALSWMESGATDQPDALAALAISAVLLARGQNLHVVPLPVWAAWPALGHPDDPWALPRLRPAVARDLSGGDRAPWGVVFLGFVAEAARAGLRELDRLEAAAEAGRVLGAGLDQRSRVPAAVALVLASPVVTPRGVAETLGVTPQAANRVLGRLAAGGVVKEVTGRGSFRAFAV